MTKSELEQRLRNMTLDYTQLVSDKRQLQEIVRVYERAFGVIENLSRRSTNYWSGS